MPAKTIAACASRQAIPLSNASALVTLDDVVYFPIASQVSIAPTAQVENHGIAAKVAMPFRLLPNGSQFEFRHLGYFMGL